VAASGAAMSRKSVLPASLSPTSPFLYCNHNAIVLQISKYFSFIGSTMVGIKEATRNIWFCTHKTSEPANPKKTKSPICADAEAAPLRFESELKYNPNNKATAPRSHRTLNLNSKPPVESKGARKILTRTSAWKRLGRGLPD
jgi:hypothetical protein